MSRFDYETPQNTFLALKYIANNVLKVVQYAKSLGLDAEELRVAYKNSIVETVQHPIKITTDGKNFSTSKMAVREFTINKASSNPMPKYLDRVIDNPSFKPMTFIKHYQTLSKEEKQRINPKLNPKNKKYKYVVKSMELYDAFAGIGEKSKAKKVLDGYTKSSSIYKAIFFNTKTDADKIAKSVRESANKDFKVYVYRVLLDNNTLKPIELSLFNNIQGYVYNKEVDPINGYQNYPSPEAVNFVLEWDNIPRTTL